MIIACHLAGHGITAQLESGSGEELEDTDSTLPPTSAGGLDTLSVITLSPVWCIKHNLTHKKKRSWLNWSVSSPLLQKAYFWANLLPWYEFINSEQAEWLTFRAAGINPAISVQGEATTSASWTALITSGRDYSCQESFVTDWIAPFGMRLLLRLLLQLCCCIWVLLSEITERSCRENQSEGMQRHNSCVSLARCWTSWNTSF